MEMERIGQFVEKHLYDAIFLVIIIAHYGIERIRSFGVEWVCISIMARIAAAAVTFLVRWGARFTNAAVDVLTPVCVCIIALAQPGIQAAAAHMHIPGSPFITATIISFIFLSVVVLVVNAAATILFMFVSDVVDVAGFVEART